MELPYHKVLTLNKLSAVQLARRLQDEHTSDGKISSRSTFSVYWTT